MPAAREIHLHNAHPKLRLDRRAVIRALRLLDAAAERFEGGPGAGELSVAFLTDDALARLHADFLEDPSTTDVITFEAQAALGSAGEICVSADTARTYARDHARAFSEELTLYVVHGWLHLAGYDDLAPARKRRMRAAEARAMALLREARAIPAFRWA
jgi:probable rRNA maturation factor